MKKTFLLFTLLVISLFAFSACSQKTEDLLSKDAISIGIRDDTPGFAFNNGSGKVIGFEVDLANAIADRLGKQANFVIVTDKTRNSYLKEGKIDMIVAVYTITDDRKKQVDFSQPYYTDHLVFTVRPGSNYQSPADLEGKKIAVTKNTTSETAIYDVLLQEDFSAEIVVFDTFSDANTAFLSGDVDALFMDASITHGYRGTGGRILDQKYSPQGYGIATRKTDVDFTASINDIITELKNNGALDDMMAHWELSPI